MSRSRFQPGGMPQCYNYPRAGPGQQQQSKPTQYSSGKSARSLQRRSKVQCYRCHRYGHHKAECPSNFSQSVVGNAQLAVENSVPILIKRMVGQANQVSMYVNERQITAVLDTGSMVNSVSMYQSLV